MRRDASILAVVAAIALLMAAGAQATVVQLAGGRRAGVQVRPGSSMPGVVTAVRSPGGRRALQTQGPCIAGPGLPGDVSYWCGPVLHSTRDYLVFWDPSGAIDQATRSLFERYLIDVSVDSGEEDDVFGVVRQFYDSTGFAGAHQQFAPGQAIQDSDAYPATDTSTCSLSDCVTDDQIQAELGSLASQEGLPRGLPGAAAPLYVVVLPPSETVCVASTGGPACSASDFCAYHSALADNTAYAVIPLSVLAADPKGCQGDDTSTVQEPNGIAADVAIDAMSHEINEAITDPLGNGWWDGATGSEVADDCELYGPSADENNPYSSGGPENPNAYAPVLGGDPSAGTLYDQLINGDPYYTQTVWSNADANCESHPVAQSIGAVFTAPSVVPVGSTVTLNPAGSFAAGGLSSTTWSFGDGTSSFSTSAPVTTTHTYTQPGTYTAALLVVDQHGNLSAAIHTIRAAVPPTPGFAVTVPAHAGPQLATGEALHFDGARTTDPNGAAIVRYGWSFGDGHTATGRDPAHSFARAGTYSVTLAVTDALGLSQTITEGVTVSPAGRVVRVSTSGRRLQVRVTGAGTVRAAGRSVRLRRGGTAKLALRLTRAQSAQLAQRHRVTVRVTVTYSPTAGRQIRHTYRVTVR